MNAVQPSVRSLFVLLFQPSGNPRNHIHRWNIPVHRLAMPVGDFTDGELQAFLRRGLYRFEVEEDSIELYKPSPPIHNRDARALFTSKEAIKSSAIEVGLTESIQIFWDGMGPEDLNMIVVAEGTKHPESFYASLHVSFCERLEQYAKRDAYLEPPSVLADVSVYFETQSNPETMVYDGRYPYASSSAYGGEHSPYLSNVYIDTTALPVQLYSQVFARFTARVNASAIFRENEDRTRELHDIYETVLDCEIIQRCVGHSTLEGCITVMLEDDETCVAALRQQNERGSENGDVNVRISAEYKRYWLGETTTAVRSRTRCPTLLLTFQGPLLTVSGAILTDRWIVQTLATCSVSRVSSLDAAHQLKVTQIFHACRLAISELKTFYRSIDLTSALTTWRPYDHSRWFPAATTYRDDKGNEITFVYQRPMTAGSRCTTFLVEELKGKKLRVVKFSERYGDQVHRCLAEANLAPKLLYSGPPFIDGTSYDNVRMTVMDPVLGESLHKSKESLTPKHKEQLKQAVDLLGEKGFVHGDIRKPNVLIDGKSNIKIIDFEWAGEEGKVQFPVYLNSDEFMGAKAFDFIQHRHDVDLVERLLNEDPTGDQ